MALPPTQGVPGLTVVQGDEEDPLDHVVDVELLAELPLRAEGAADLGHRIVAVVQALGDTVVGVILADGRLLACMTEPSAPRGTAPAQGDRLAPSPRAGPCPRASLDPPTCQMPQLLLLLDGGEVLGSSNGAEEGSEGVAGDAVVVLLVGHLPSEPRHTGGPGQGCRESRLQGPGPLPRARRTRPARCGGSGPKPLPPVPPRPSPESAARHRVAY